MYGPLAGAVQPLMQKAASCGKKLLFHFVRKVLRFNWQGSLPCFAATNPECVSSQRASRGMTVCGGGAETAVARLAVPVVSFWKTSHTHRWSFLFPLPLIALACSLDATLRIHHTQQSTRPTKPSRPANLYLPVCLCYVQISGNTKPPYGTLSGNR